MMYPGVMEQTSPFRNRPYRKPLWLRLAVLMLVITLSLIVSQYILRDRQIMGIFIDAGQKIVEFAAVEKQYREMQANELQGLEAEQAARAAAPERPAAPAPEAAPRVMINRHIGGDEGNTGLGFKRVRVEEPAQPPNP